jgi:hypothetical protein
MHPGFGNHFFNLKVVVSGFENAISFKNCPKINNQNQRTLNWSCAL